MRFVTVEHEGRRLRLAVAKAEAGVWVSYPGGAVLVEKERRTAARRQRDGEVRAPMTAKVVQVLALPGTTVAAEQLLVVLEAMKMEYRLTAPREGVVEAVHCKPGELVDLGEVLVTLSAAASAA